MLATHIWKCVADALVVGGTGDFVLLGPKVVEQCRVEKTVVLCCKAVHSDIIRPVLGSNTPGSIIIAPGSIEQAIIKL